MIKYILGTLLTILCIYNDENISHFLVTNKLTSWTMSYLAVYFIALIGLVLMIFSTFKLLFNKKIKITLALLGSIIIIVFLFIKKTPYLEDYNRMGSTITNQTYPNNITLDSIHAKYPDFNGVIAIASATCPHCMAAAKKFNILKHRQPKIDILFVMFTLNQDKLNEFRNETNAFDIDYILAPDEKGTLDICQGRFPTFVYLRNGEVIHQWTNNELGYPAFDWIENELN